VFLVCRWDVWGLTGRGKTVSHVKVPLTFGTVGATSGSDFRSGRPCDSMPVIEESRWVFLVCRWDVWGLTGRGKTVSHVKVPLTFGTVGATSGSDFRSGRPCDSMPVIEESRWVFLVCRWDVWGLTGRGKTVSHVKVPLTFGTVGATSGSDFRSGRPCDSMPVIEESRWVFLVCRWDVWGLTGRGKTVSHVKVPLTFGTVGATSGSDFRSGRPCDSMPVIEESRWVFLVCRWDVWGLTGRGKTVSHVKVPLTFGTVGATSGSDFRSGRPCDSMPVIEESRWVFLVCRWDVWGLTGRGKTVSHVKVPLTFGTVGATSGSDFRSGRPCDSMPVIEESRWVFFPVSGVDQGLRYRFFLRKLFFMFFGLPYVVWAGCGLGGVDGRSFE
jgi:hypothetical protein